LGLVDIIACDKQLAGKVYELKDRGGRANSFKSGHCAIQSKYLMLRGDQRLSERSSRLYGPLVAGAQLFSKAELLQLAALCTAMGTIRGEQTTYQSAVDRLVLLIDRAEQVESQR
jgi:hypothetical protein